MDNIFTQIELKKIFLDYPFEEACEQLSEDLISDLYLPKDEDFECFSGASKYVIACLDRDFVIKVPYKGSTNSYSCWSSTAGTYAYDTYGCIKYTEEFEPFMYAADDADGDDYCRVEELRYEKAVEVGLDFLFAPTKKIGEIRGVSIYAQPYCETFDSTGRLMSLNQKSNAFKLCKEKKFHCFNESWLNDVYCQYGAAILLNFLQFCDEVGIDDLHRGNVGYYNGLPVLIDYSGFDG